MGWLSRVRGGDAALPKVRIGSEQDYVDRSRGEPPDAEQLAKAEAWNRGLSQFKLAPAIYDREEQEKAIASEVGAVYFSDEREILVVDRGEPMSDDHAVATLAHELVHAQQDAEHRLGELRKQHVKTFDAGLALRGLTEGEAVLYQALAIVELAGRSPEEVDWQRWFDEWRNDELESADEDEAPYLMSYMRFPYAFGGGFVSQAWLDHGRSAIDALYADPPLHTRNILFPDQQLDLADAVRETRAQCLPALSEGFELQEFATLGAWVSYLYQRRVQPKVRDRWFLAQQLAADCFAVQANAVGQIASSWHVSMLPGASGSAWPGADELSFVRRSVPETGSEAFLIGTQLIEPPDPGALDWGDVDTDASNAMAAAAPDAFRLETACGARLPALVLRTAPAIAQNR